MKERERVGKREGGGSERERAHVSESFCASRHMAEAPSGPSWNSEFLPGLALEPRPARRTLPAADFLRGQGGPGQKRSGIISQREAHQKEGSGISEKLQKLSADAAFRSTSRCRAARTRHSGRARPLQSRFPFGSFCVSES